MEKWERTKEKVTDWFDYKYDRTIRRSPDARKAYKERVQEREAYWAHQEELKASRREEELRRREDEIQKFLDDKLPLIPSPPPPVHVGEHSSRRVQVTLSQQALPSSHLPRPGGDTRLPSVPAATLALARPMTPPRMFPLATPRVPDIIVTSPDGTRRRPRSSATRAMASTVFGRGGGGAAPRGYFVRPRNRRQYRMFRAGLLPLAEEDEEEDGERVGHGCGASISSGGSFEADRTEFEDDALGGEEGGRREFSLVMRPRKEEDGEEKGGRKEKDKSDDGTVSEDGPEHGEEGGERGSAGDGKLEDEPSPHSKPQTLSRVSA